MRRKRYALRAVAGIVAALTAGCGGDAPQQSRPLRATDLQRALALARDAGRLPVRLDATTTRPGRGTPAQFSATGSIDLAARTGDATLRAEGLPPGLEISWTAQRLSGPGPSLSRAAARRDGSLLGLLPDQLQATAEVVADATGVRERPDGSVTFTVAAADALRRGMPRHPRAGTTWSGEARAAVGGRLRRVVLRLPTPALGAAIPAGVLTLDLRLG